MVPILLASTPITASPDSVWREIQFQTAEKEVLRLRAQFLCYAQGALQLFLRRQRATERRCEIVCE